MTDKDVIKALEIESTPMERNCVRATYKEDCLGFYCTKTGKLAENCMECKEHTMDWRGRHSKATLDLINRQQAEIEKLERVISYLEGVCESTPDKVRAEAIKEYKEKLKEHAYLDSGITGFQEMVVDLSDIENIAEEMVGEGK